MFWNYEFRWVGSLHYWAVLQITKTGRVYMVLIYQAYKLIEDAAYMVRPCIYCLFKGVKTALSDKMTNENFIQFSTRICVKMSFGILKDKWRLIIKRLEISLKNISYIIVTCIVLHNLCIVNNEGIEEDIIVEAKNKLATRVIEEELQEGNEL